MNMHAQFQPETRRSQEAFQREAGLVDFLMTCNREECAAGLLIFATMPAVPCTYSVNELRADIDAFQSGLEARQ